MKKLTVRKTLMTNEEVLRCEGLLAELRKDITRKHRLCGVLRKKYYTIKGELYQLKRSEEDLARKVFEHYEGVHIISDQRSRKPRKISLDSVTRELKKLGKEKAAKVLQQMIRNLTQ